MKMLLQMASRSSLSIFKSSSNFKSSFSSSTLALADDNKSWAERGEKVFLENYGKRALTLTRGDGSYVWDVEGLRYLDLTSGIAVSSLGHGHPAVLARMRELVADGALLHVSNYYLTPPAVRLAEKLVAGREDRLLSRVFFANSGTEANEAALKFARRAHPQRQGRVVAFHDGFHGRSAGSLSVTHKPAIREQFLPLTPGVSFFPYNCPTELLAGSVKEAGAVIVEPLQGEGGVRPASKGFLEGLRRLCDESGTLLIFDEVQVGCSRTGSLWAHQQLDVDPDLMTLAKPLAAGLPIGAVLMRERLHPLIKAGDHGSTFAGGPFVTAVAEAAFDVLSSPELLANVRARGLQFWEGLHRLREDPRLGIVDIRSSPLRGLLIGVEFSSPVADRSE